MHCIIDGLRRDDFSELMMGTPWSGDGVIGDVLHSIDSAAKGARTTLVCPAGGHHPPGVEDVIEVAPAAAALGVSMGWQKLLANIPEAGKRELLAENCPVMVLCPFSGAVSSGLITKAVAALDEAGDGVVVSIDRLENSLHPKWGVLCDGMYDSEENAISRSKSIHSVFQDIDKHELFEQCEQVFTLSGEGGGSHRLAKLQYVSGGVVAARSFGRLVRHMFADGRWHFISSETVQDVNAIYKQFQQYMFL